MLPENFKDKAINKGLVKAMANLKVPKKIKIMEVCGTHTMAIAEAGIKQFLPEGVSLISGPGCPVCVTPASKIDGFLELAMRKDIIVTTYGDMIRVPGSTRGDNLARRRAQGAKVEMVYSPVDALKVAEDNPSKQVVFIGVGFETTAPGTAAACIIAQERGLKNFFVLPMLKTVEPALRALEADDDFDIDGFLCPGHVATIIGEKGFEYLPNELKIPGVIAGFETGDILTAVYDLLSMIIDKKHSLKNDYQRGVLYEGNLAAMDIINKVFSPIDDEWRGLGVIKSSGLTFSKEFEKFNAEKRFDIHYKDVPALAGCKCGEIIKGKKTPAECPLFGKVCTTDDPVGPCMVSSEGACAAYYKYRPAE